jgi:sugar phosphate isomerase/epimerase
MDIGVAHLTALALEPARFVPLAAHYGYRSVGLRTNPAMPGGLAYPVPSGTQAHQELKRIFAHEGMRLNDIEFIPMVPDFDPANYEAMLESGAGLGAQSVNVSGDDPDLSRLADHMNELCVLAQTYHMRVDLEFMRWRCANSFDTALRIASQIHQPNFGILVDTLHLFRSHGSGLDFERPGARDYVRHVQLSDSALPQIETDEQAMAEARGERCAIGAGLLPLNNLRPFLPDHAVFSVEFPNDALSVEARLETGFQSAQSYLKSAV